MFDFEIARYLYRVSFLYDNVRNSPYKARAYFKAALAVDGYTSNIEKLYNEGNITELPSVGLSIGKSIGEIISTNHLVLLDELLGDIPESVFELYEYASIRERLLRKLIENNIYSISAAQNALDSNKITLSATEHSDITDAIVNYENRKFQFAHVYELSNDLRKFLLSNKLVSKCDFVGELFARNDTMTDGKIICCPLVNHNVIMSEIRNYRLFSIIANMEETIILERFSIPFIIYTALEKDYFSKRDYLTINMKKSVLCTSSRDIVKTIHGDLHLHTDWSDGLHTIEQMRDYAMKLGYKYVAITDHSQSLKPSGMSELDTLTQIKKIRELNKISSIPILSGIEVDIKPDGCLDLPDSILKEFDFVIASIHTQFNQGLLLIDRLSKALANPYVNVLGHPMGRLLGKPGKPTVCRDEMSINFDFLLQLCKEYNVAMEINCFPERFDLSLENAVRAIQAGVKLSIGSDSHSMYHMDCVQYALEGLCAAKVPKEFILNCYLFDELRFLLDKKLIGGARNTSDVFELKFKDFSHYFSSHSKIINGQAKVIGIDLTGSETKPSGFATMSGVHVETELLLTDNEIVNKIVDVNPLIISIDSPLSLPEGRCCENKDCECAKFGILRYCERLLRHFNIGVYPCLIDSMVNLTMRGIQLADRLRSLRYEVIESYPGVAQDLLQIPRKRNKKGNGYEPLLNGLKNFGIKDIKPNISHDEADAITSALVGYFYIANKYVGLGNEKEGFLIVPCLESPLTGRGFVIGLVGRIAAGKTTVAEYMRFKYGFESMQFSKVISELYSVSGRDELQRIGLEIAKDSKKQKALSEYMIQKMKAGYNYIIDGIRQKEDYENLSNKLGDKFVLVSIDASQNIRAKRYMDAEPSTTKDEFALMDKHPVEKAISFIEIKSQCHIKNNKGYSTLRSYVDTLVKKLSN